MQPQAIIKMIDDFCKKNTNATAGILPGYCFEHIVLGDYNLGNGNIDFCLEESRIAKWIKDKIKDIHTECIWQTLGAYSDIIDYAYSVVVFLNNFKEIPESEREAAMNWYNRGTIELMQGKEQCQK